MTADGDKQGDADDLVKQLQEAIARGDIQVETLGEKVVVNFTPTEAEQKDLPQLLQETLNAIDKAKSATGKADQEVLVWRLRRPACPIGPGGQRGS